MLKHKRGGKHPKDVRSKLRAGLHDQEYSKVMRDCRAMQYQREESRRERMSRAYEAAGYEGAEDANE